MTNTMNTTTSSSISTFTAIEWALSAANTNHVARDIAAKSQRWTLSEKQEAYVVNAYKWAQQRKEEAAAKAAAGITAPTGRQVVTGKVTKVTSQDTNFGWVTKVIVELPTGARVRGNAPSAVDPEVGQQVTFTATFNQADGDAAFAFWSRPSKWSVKEEEVAA
jgi:hypothetical protein